MAEITAHSSLQEVAAIISQALVAHGVDATLSGGAAVSIYTDNRYQSHDLDFVSTAGINTLARVVNKLGFVVTPSRRLFAHPESSGCRHQQPADPGNPLGAVACDSADPLCDGSARCLAAGLQTHAAQLSGRGISEGGVDHSQPADGERLSQPLLCGNSASFLRLAPGLFCVRGGKGKPGRWLLVYSARPNGFPKGTIARFCCGTMASVSASLLADSWGAPVAARLSRPWAL